MDLNRLQKTFDDGIVLLHKLQEMLDAQLSVGNVHSTTASVVAINKSIVSTAASLVRMRAATNEIWSKDDVEIFLRAMADAMSLALDNVLPAADLPEPVKRELRYDILTEATRLFLSTFDESQQQVTEDRRNGVTAFDIKLLNKEEQR